MGRDGAREYRSSEPQTLPGLFEDPSLDKFLENLPIAIAWLFRERETQDGHEVPFEVPLVVQERARIRQLSR
jgi:hypothetical protein